MANIWCELRIPMLKHEWWDVIWREKKGYTSRRDLLLIFFFAKIFIFNFFYLFRLIDVNTRIIGYTLSECTATQSDITL